MARTLQIIEGAYRCNIEEQDAPAVWMTGAIKGVEVSVVADDAAERGLERGAFVDGVRSVSRRDLPKLLAGYDRVWRW